MPFFKFHEADQSVLHEVEDLIAQYHNHLSEASIAVVFREETDYRRKLPTFYGKAQLVPSQFRPWMDYDILLIINEDEWIDLNDAQRMALLDHLLSFCGITPNLAWTMNKPQISEFIGVIRRNGYWSRELDLADTAQQSYAQKRLPGTDDTQITVSAGGRVATITGERLEQLAENLGKSK